MQHNEKIPSTIQSFFLAMTLHTSMQQKAQAELDAVVGADRLPTPADRERLPYFEALLCEVIRTYACGIGAYNLLPHSYFTFRIQHSHMLFHACASELMHTAHVTGPPHMVREDDVYNGYFIPKGAIVLVNITSVHLIIRYHASKGLVDLTYSSFYLLFIS
jgi:Cytochrome P450